MPSSYDKDRFENIKTLHLLQEVGVEGAHRTQCTNNLGYQIHTCEKCFLISKLEDAWKELEKLQKAQPKCSLCGEDLGKTYWQDSESKKDVCNGCHSRMYSKVAGDGE